jgi:glycyl-tRNA synthetase alpha chain
MPRPTTEPMTFQRISRTLDDYWADHGCTLLYPYNSEVGAGTFNPGTFFKVLGPGPWRTAFVELSKRPKDGRYGLNPLRFQQFCQYQVILKPSPNDVQDLCLGSLEALGIKTRRHDIRFVEDDWESPTLGAWGLGWELWLDGMEILQFTYFQQMGSLDLDPVSVELTYGLGRIAMAVQDKPSVLVVDWSRDVRWGDIYLENERGFSRFNFEEADIELHLLLFDRFEDEAKRLLDDGLIYPGYDHVIKCSHLFNVLDARGAISVSERANYIARVRRLARRAALAYLKAKEESSS